MKEQIEKFFDYLSENKVELYNEAGLQHELAYYLKIMGNGDLKVKLEYPATKIHESLKGLMKKEVDIYIEDKQEKKYVIELKMPKGNGGIPNAMYNAIKDVKFLEQIKEKSNNEISGFAILATPCKSIWTKSSEQTGIYQMFNDENPEIRSIQENELHKFLKARNGINLEKSYSIEWKTLRNHSNWRYYLITIK